MDHLIQTTDKIMKLVGMQVFDLDSLAEFSDSHQKNSGFSQYITINEDGKPCTPKELRDGILSGDAEIQRWDDDTREYSNRALSSYPIVSDLHPEPEWAAIAHNLNLREKYRDSGDDEDYFSDYTFNLSQCKELTDDIINSASGSLSWHPQLYYVINGQVKDFTPKLSMVLFDSHKISTNREIASYSPFIADIPKTKGGSSYGARETEAKESKDGIGSYRPPIEGGRSNPDNLRAGEIDLTYNEVTGKYEGGTRQVLVRLLTDIAPVSATAFDPENIHSISVEETYTKDGDFNQVGDWTKDANIGSGVPLNIQKGNPYLFGPNYISRYDKDNPYKKEVIRVTNRTPRTFVAKQLVLCSYLDGEWIPQDLGEDSGLSAAATVQKWKFQKLIASSDAYFRDARYLDPEQPERVAQRISPESYEQLSRNKFYVNLMDYTTGSSAVSGSGDVEHLLEIDEEILSRVGFMNLGNTQVSVDENRKEENWDVVPSDKYIQVTAFDQMGNFAGGKNRANVIAKTNFQAPLDSEEVSSVYDMIEYWGPTFPRGFNSEDVNDLSSSRGEVTLKPTPEYGQYKENPFFFPRGENTFEATPEEPALVDNLPNRNVSINYADKGMFNNTADRAALNLPAEVGTNGPPSSTYSSPVEALQFLDYTSREDVNSIDAYKAIFIRDEHTGVQRRFNWLYKYDESDSLSGIFNPVYGFRPNSPNSIDFYPLAAEVVSSTDYNRGGTSEENGVALEYGMLPLMAKASETRAASWHHSQSENGVDHLLGSDDLFFRNGEEKVDFIQYSFNGGKSPANPDKKNYTVPYFGYVEKPSTGKNKISLPTIWPDENNENASCVGVIASQCRIKFRGDQLKFTLDQQFGLQLNNVATLSSSSSFNFLNLGGGIGLSLAGGSSFSNSNAYPRWGGLSDEPDRFNITALHVKVFDAWPEDQTLYDARYFAVFHFNPGQLMSPADKSDEEVTVGPFSFYPDILTEEVDFKVPTYRDNSVIPVGTRIDGEVQMADSQYWRVNTIRRGMMLTNGGFSYYRSVCGVNSYVIIDGGSGYQNGEILSVSGGSGSGATVKVTTDNGEITGITVEDRGEGYLPEDFGTPGEPETSSLTLTGGTGSSANIKVTGGIIYRKEGLDEGPEDRSGGYQRLSEGNSNGQGNQGDGFVSGTNEEFIPISEQNDSGEYDLFFHFHNDVTHTVHYGGGNMLIKPQRVSMQISAI